MHRLQQLALWVRHLPVADIAWYCTACVAVLIVLFALPAFFRRIRRTGDRASLRLLIVVILLAAGVAIEVLLDTGYRTHVAQTSATQVVTNYGQILASPAPFPVAAYYGLNRSLVKNSKITGTIAELTGRADWKDIRTGSTFPAPILGVPSHGSGSSKGQAATYFTSLISNTGKSLPLVSLRPGFAFVSASVARSRGIKVGDDLFAVIRGTPTYVRAAGIVLDGQLLNSPQGIIMSLADVQQQLGLVGRVSSVLVTYDAPSASELSTIRAAVAREASAIPPSKVNETSWQSPIAVTVHSSADSNRLLAAAGVVLVLFGTVGMVILGRKPKPVRGRGHA
jgi:hypothetical protein